VSAPPVDSPRTLRFGPFRLDLRAGQLFRDDQSIPLRPKTWSVLHYLAERPGVLVTKNALLDAVWSNIAVTEAVLSKSIGELRVALGDSSKSPRLIETVQRRGFRFIAPISPEPRVLSPEFTDADLGAQNAAPTTPFVGRGKELQRLAALFAKARAGARQLVFISGPAGIGKTALVERFLAQLSAVGSPSDRTPEALMTCLVARGQCVDLHGPREAYLPVLEALDRLARQPDSGHLLGLLRRVAPTWLAQMPWLIGDDDEAGLRRALQAVRPERMLREFAALVEALTTDRTLVLVLEDLHWSDAATVDLLTVLAERREAARVLVIGTYRPAEAVVRAHVLMTAARALEVRQFCVALALHDLPEAGVRSYLEARFPGSDFPPLLARLIHAHTDGNPLFMSAVVDHLRARGDILHTAPGWALAGPMEQLDLGVPDNVRQLIESQLDGLSPADRALLEAASVAGDSFTTVVVAAALGCEVVDAEIRCEAFARAQRFLRVTGRVEWPDGSVARRYAFTHELYRQAVYAEIPEGRCMRLHQRIGEALEAAYAARPTDIAPQLALHFERGRDGTRALHYLTAAAAGARQRFAGREAIGYLEAALALVALLPENDERHRRELELRLSLGASLGDVYGFAAEPVRVNYERASALCAVVGSAAQLLGVLYARWYLHAMRGQGDETIALAAEMEALVRRLRGTETRLLADSVLVRTALYDGRFVDAERHMQRLLARPRRRQPAAAPVAYGADPLTVAASHSAIGQWFLGHPERARRTAAAALARARASGHFFTGCAVLTQAALVDLLCRHAVTGGDLAEQAVALSAEHGFALWHAMASVLRGWALVQRGRASEGTTDIHHGLAAMQATGMRFFSGLAYAFLAEGYLRAGALPEGVAAADAGLMVAQATLNRPYEPELWRLKGELVRSKLQGPTPTAHAGRKRPARAEAEACFQRALELARATQAKSLELRAATSLARAWHERGRTAEAHTLLAGICKWFGARATSADLLEARALLGELTTAR
jgi:DNA-binding winged helix-turn-helix (wHTH) protein/predicted ATPase